MFDRFLVFVRRDKQAWRQHAAVDNVALALHEAQIVARTFTRESDRAAVMEVSGVDAAPMFSFLYAVKK